MKEFIKEIGKMRDTEINHQKKCKCEDGNDKGLFLYMEGRISAFSDALLKYYYHYQDKEEK